MTLVIIRIEFARLTAKTERRAYYYAPNLAPCASKEYAYSTGHGGFLAFKI